MYATLCHYPTDLVLDDVVADIVLVVKDLLTGTVSRCLKHCMKEASLPNVCH